MGISLDLTLDGDWADAQHPLEQNLLQIQSAFNGVVEDNDLDTIGDEWVQVPWAATLFSTNAAGAINPTAVAPFALTYKVTGSTAWVNVTAVVGVTNGMTTEIRIALPSAIVPLTLMTIGTPVENVHRTSGVWSGGGLVSGIALVGVNISGRYLLFQRADGSVASAFPVAACTLGAMVQIPLA